MYTVNFIFMANDAISIRKDRAFKFFTGKSPLKIVPGWITQNYKTCENYSNYSTNELYKDNKRQIDFYKSIYDTLYNLNVLGNFDNKDLVTARATCRMFANSNDDIIQQIEEFFDIQDKLIEKKDFDNVLLQPADYIFNIDNKQKYIENNSVVHETDTGALTLAFTVLYYPSHIDIYLFMHPTILLSILPCECKNLEKIDNINPYCESMLLQEKANNNETVVNNDSITINNEEKKEEENNMYSINIISMDNEDLEERESLADEYLKDINLLDICDVFNGWSCDINNADITKDNMHAVMTSIIYKSIDFVYTVIPRQHLTHNEGNINDIYKLLFTGFDEMKSIESLYEDKIDIYGDEFIISEYIDYNEIKNDKDVLIFSVLIYEDHADILLFMNPKRFFGSEYYIQPSLALQNLTKESPNVDPDRNTSKKNDPDIISNMLGNAMNNTASNISKGLSGVRLTPTNNYVPPTPTPIIVPTPPAPVNDGGISDIYSKTIFQIYDEIGYKSNKSLLPLDNTTVAVIPYREIYTTEVNNFSDENAINYNINNPDARMMCILHEVIVPVLSQQHLFKDTNAITVKELVDSFYKYYTTIDKPSLKDLTIDHILEILDKIEMSNAIYKNGRFFRYDAVLVNGKPYFKLDPEPIVDPMLYRIQFAGGYSTVYKIKDVYNECPDTLYWITDRLQENA